MERRHVDVIAIRVFWTLVLFAYVAVFSTGCGLANPVAVSPTNEKEAWAVSETARFAGMLHIQLVGKVIAQEYIVPAGQQGCPASVVGGCHAAAWYTPKVVYFWQTFVNRESTTLGNLSDVAAHETCHSMTPNHDALLYNCIRSLGQDPQFVPTEEK